jgi:hypothetical protein
MSRKFVFPFPMPQASEQSDAKRQRVNFTEAASGLTIAQETNQGSKSPGAFKAKPASWTSSPALRTLHGCVTYENL